MEISAEETIKKRKEKIFSLLKNKREWIYYLVLSFIVFIGVYIRTRNIPGLKDITTGTWTLGPDLDPFLFLRWAEYIVGNGSLFAHDIMRYVPLGYDTAGEMKLLSYMIAWFYHTLSFFNKDMTITYAAIWFPVVMFALTAIAFFLFTRKIFYKESNDTKNIIALIATLLFVLVPSLLPRTIAGIPEKESVAFGFMFLAFYLFLEAFTSEKLKRKLILGVLAGVSTALMGLVWGGVIFIYFTISTAVLLSFILGKIKRDEFIVYSAWMFTSFAVMMPFSTRYALENLIVSDSTGLSIGVWFIVGLSLIFMKLNKVEELRKKTKLPKEIFSLIISAAILLVVILSTLGFNFIIEQTINVKNSLINPQTSRFGLTVAENKQPYFINDWKGNFGPVFREIPLFFWLFFAGTIVLFKDMIEKLNKKEKLILTGSYFIFLTCLIFSKYSSGSNLNGTNGLSVTVYFAGWIFFMGTFGYYYYIRHKKNESSVFNEFNFSYILYFIVLTLGIIGARAGIRLIMVLGAVSPIAISFLIVKASEKYLKEKEEFSKIFFGGILLIILISSIFTAWTYYKSDMATSSVYVPGTYQWQWQKAMEWVRDKTPENAVFAHWSDYGYWLQSIGERATILDGGNSMGSWDYYMGRLVLTGTQKDEKNTMEWLYTHNATHFLIDSTDIGKYTAFSSIGSDENYDRISFIPNLLMDDKQTREMENETTYIYPSGFAIDDDIIINEDGKEILLPRKAAGIGAILLTMENDYPKQPDVIFVYNGKQYNEKLRYLYLNNNLIDFNSGIEAGIFIFPRVDLTNGQYSLNNIGAAFYLSPRVVNSNLARLYLFDQNSDNFKLVHTESNLFVDNLKQQGINAGEFVYFQGFQGPIKIWEIKYPAGIESNQEYLSTDYPNKVLDIAVPGEY